MPGGAEARRDGDGDGFDDSEMTTFPKPKKFFARAYKILYTKKAIPLLSQGRGPVTAGRLSTSGGAKIEISI